MSCLRQGFEFCKNTDKHTVKSTCTGWYLAMKQYSIRCWYRCTALPLLLFYSELLNTYFVIYMSCCTPIATVISCDSLCIKETIKLYEEYDQDILDNGWQRRSAHTGDKVAHLVRCSTSNQ